MGYAGRFWLLVACVAFAGCSRKHYRERADAEVNGLMAQKNVFPAWGIEHWHVYPDEKARFADPANPDNPPYPPDDYPAWLLSPNPQRPNKASGSGRFEGTAYLECIERWDAENRAKDDAKPVEGRPPYRLTLDQSMELALFNSREFQDRREDLYLAALPVTEQRFSFAAQVLAGTLAVREFAGSERPDAGNRWRLDTNASVSRLFPTGATLLFRFANEIVFDLTSSRPDISLTNLSLTLAQPLLAGGGFAVTLENLTQSERTLLYAIRSYARYRKIFYAAISVAADYTNNPYGLSGLSVNLGRGVGVNFTAPSVGYLPTVLRAANLTNDRRNITALEQNLSLIKNLMEGGNSTQLQVIQAEQQLLTSSADYLASQRLYQDQLDSFKLQLGVPATLALELDDAPLRPMRKQLQKYDDLYAQMTDFENAAARFEPDDRDETVRVRWRKLLTEYPLVNGTPFAKDYAAASERLSKIADEPLDKKLRELFAERQKLLDAKADRQLAGKPDTAQDLAGIEAVEAAVDLIRFEQALRVYAARPWLRVPVERRPIEQANSYRAVSDYGTLLGIRARNQRNDSIRAAWPNVAPVELDGDDLLTLPIDEANTKASQTALNLRLDLMNTRAQVVDAYRQIAVRANALQGVLNVQYDLAAASPSNANGSPASGNRTLNAVTLRYDPPLVRRVERNLYRTSLIAYQRQRRFLMAVEDNVVNDVRADLRQVKATAETYRLQARAVELAYAQVDAARSTLVAPPDPVQKESAGNIAALTDQLLRAQAQLLRSQNALYTVWVNYQVARTTLYLDLELLPLDAQGLWTDDALPSAAEPAPAPTPIP